MEKVVIQGQGLPESPLPYSPAIRVGQFLFVAGHASTDKNGNIVAGTFREEFTRTFDNLRRVLAVAGLTLNDVVQVRSYVARQEDLVEYNQLYRDVFTPPYPARTTLIGCLGTMLKYEVDVIAIAPTAEEISP
jgi:2-iminobutanoate/2-iminopropanoate deaminase